MWEEDGKNEVWKEAGNCTTQDTFTKLSDIGIGLSPYIIQGIQNWELCEKHTLYNLSVEEDESYIAKGMVVHNCRCIALPTMPERQETPKEK